MNYYYLALVIFSVFHVSLALRIPSQATTRTNGPSEFNVLSYGAIGDGKQDDTQAFSKAWSDVCGATDRIPTLILPPQKTFLLSPILFSGPCKSPSIHVQILGTIVAPSTRDGWKNCIENCWLVFAHINNLIVDGSGVIDGQGASWWNNINLVNSDEHINDGTCDRPKALIFRDCNGLHLQGLTHVNSPTAHLSIEGCNNSIITNIHIEAPANSPNTDGIDISQSTQVQIRDSTIATGDDCIAMGTGMSWINITGVTCGPGHGISIGSLGKNGAHAEVEQVYIKNCTFKGTTNGARIKTWQGGAGYARSITFEDIPLINVQNPIIIDQYYCDGGHDCGTQASAVEISGVTYRGFQGTSARPAAITLNCSDTVACTGLLMERIDITSTNPQQQTIAVCRNAQGRQDSAIPQVPCLQ